MADKVVTEAVPLTDESITQLAILAIRIRDANFLPTAMCMARRAFSLAPKDAKIAGTLGNILFTAGRLHEARSFTEQAMRLDPSLTILHHNLGLIAMYMGQLEKAIRHLELVADVSTDAAWDRACALMLDGQWIKGFEGMEIRRRRAPEQHPLWGMPEWDGTPTDGTVWVTAEQGAGDVFQFARYIPWASQRCKKLIVSIPPPLSCLFVDFPGISEMRPWDDGVPEPDADWHTPLMTLPRLHGTTPDNVVKDPGWFTHLAAQFPANFTNETGRFKVGLCWAGNPAHKRDRERTIKLEQMLPITAVGRAEFFGFQTGARARDIGRLNAEALVQDLSPQLLSWLRTATALLQMDLVITVDTAIAHLAGALGVKTWVLLPRVPDWRWLMHRFDSPWYPSVRLIRQPGSGDWDGAINKAIALLESEIRNTDAQRTAAE